MRRWDMGIRWASAPATGALSGVAMVAMMLGVGCSAPPPPEVKEPVAPEATATAKPAVGAEEIPKEPVDSGMACAKAEAQCGGGVCAVKMDNGCEKAVTCEFSIVMVCQAETDLVQAKAKRRETFAAGAKESVSVAADCAANRIVSTKLAALACK